MRIVLDANVIIAAFAARGLCESVLELCLSDHQLILGEHLIEESRKCLVRKLRLPEEVTDEIISLLRQQSLPFKPAGVPEGSCRDRRDLPVLGLAIASGADCIVTGDKDLLVLRQFRGIPIHSPREFAASVKQPETR